MSELSADGRRILTVFAEADGPADWCDVVVKLAPAWGTVDRRLLVQRTKQLDRETMVLFSLRTAGGGGRVGEHDRDHRSGQGGAGGQQGGGGVTREKREQCRPVTVEVDGEPVTVSVLAEEPMSEQGRAAFAEIIKAAKRKFDSGPRRDDLCPECGFPVGTAAHRRSRKHAGGGAG